MLFIVHSFCIRHLLPGAGFRRKPWRYGANGYKYRVTM
jgi:hypothetical protein